MPCLVVHVRKALFVQHNIDCVYIGRDYAEFTDEGWGNPFHIGKDGDRAEVLRKYREWVLDNPYVLERLSLLRDKVLGCWCKPEACHGDVLAELVNALPQEEPNEC
jgi:hypothetical protein